VIVLNSMTPLTSLTARDKRALSVAAMSIALLLMIRLIPALLSWRNGQVERARLQIASVLVVSYAAQGSRVVEDSLVARRVRLAALDSAFVPAVRNGSAAEALAEFLTDAAERANVLLSSVRLESAPDSAAKARVVGSIRVHASLSGNLAGIARLLTAIERPPRLLAVRQLSITQRDPNVPHQKDETLEAEIVIDGVTDTRYLTPISPAVR